MPGAPFSTAVLIGGPAAAGKTTIARLLARKHGLRWYSTDAHGWSHRERAVAQGLHDADDPSPGSFDRGSLIQADLDQLATAAPTAGTIVEGAPITPEFAPVHRSIWLMPSADEQRRRVLERSGTTTMPDGPLYGLHLITRQLTGTLATMITVDGQTISESLAAVETALNPVLAELPTVQTISDRQQVIRYGNRSLTDQLRTGLTHGRSDGGNRAVERNFDCECGAIECTAMVRLRPADAILLAERPPGAICLCSHATR